MTLNLSSLRVLLLTCALSTACGGSPSTALPITEARSSADGTQVTVEGYVTVAPGTFVSAMSNEGFALQDATGGIYVKLAQKLDFGVGTRVRVTGTVKDEARLRILESEPSAVETLSGTQQTSPRTVTTGDINESTEGLLVRASGNVTRVFEDDSPYGYKLYFNDGSGEVQIFVHVSAGFDPAKLRAITAGQRLQVTGFAAQYKSTYELAPRQPSDLVVQ